MQTIGPRKEGASKPIGPKRPSLRPTESSGLELVCGILGLHLVLLSNLLLHCPMNG